MARAAALKPNFHELVSQAKRLSPAQRLKLARLLTENLEAKTSSAARRRRSASQRPGPGLCKGMITIVADDEDHLRDFVEYMP